MKDNFLIKVALAFAGVLLFWAGFSWHDDEIRLLNGQINTLRMDSIVMSDIIKSRNELIRDLQRWEGLKKTGDMDKLDEEIMKERIERIRPEASIMSGRSKKNPISTIRLATIFSDTSYGFDTLFVSGFNYLIPKGLMHSTFNTKRLRDGDTLTYGGISRVVKKIDNVLYNKDTIIYIHTP